jgi:predicted transcriptional regulator
MPTHVLVHLPQGFARTLRLNIAPALSDLAYRILEPLCRRDVDPTVDAVAEHYDICRSRAAGALRSLERNGLLLRWRRSYGRGYWTHFYVITDEPYAWLDDAKLKGKITHTEDQAAAYAQQVDDYADRPGFPAPPAAPAPAPVAAIEETTTAGTGTTETTARPPSLDQDDAVPVPAGRSHVESHAGNSHAIDGDITNKFSSGGELPPVPPSGQVIHSRKKVRQPRSKKAEGRTYQARIARILAAIPAESQQWLPAAVRLTSDLLHSPVARAQWVPLLVSALSSGRTEEDLRRYLADDYTTARSVAACLRYRLNLLREELRSERSSAASPAGPPGAAPNG